MTDYEWNEFESHIQQSNFLRDVEDADPREHTYTCSACGKSFKKTGANSLLKEHAFDRVIRLCRWCSIR